MIQETLRVALSKHQQGDLATASSLYLSILEQEPNNVDALGLMSLLAEDMGEHDTAIDLANKAILLKPNRVELYINLANPLLATDRIDEAIETLEKALKVDRRSIDVLSTLGDAYQEKGEYKTAIEFYHKGLRLDRSDPILYNNLGNALRNTWDYDEAISYYEKALSLNPNYVDAYFNLSLAYKEQKKNEEAKEILLKIIERDPKYHKSYSELGRFEFKEQNLDEAIYYFRLALQHNPDPKDNYTNLLTLSHIYHTNQRFGEAEDCLRVALKIKPDEEEALLRLAQTLGEQCRTDESKEIFDKLCEMKPDSLTYKLGQIFCIPTISASVDAINTCRRSVNAQLDELLTLEPGKYMTNGLGITAFYMNYQGQNDRPLMEKVGQLFEKHLKPQRMISKVHHSKPKLGIISAYLSGQHTIGKLFTGLIKNLSREKFEVIIFSIEGQHGYRKSDNDHPDDQFVTLPSSDYIAARNEVASHELDIIFYPDIGMEMNTYALALNALAKVQCVSWGHPVTTGLKSMDYFISSKLIEAENAQEHYTESLFLMNQLPVFYYRPQSVTASGLQEALGVSEESTLYTCPQSLFKFHPDFDAVIADILRQDPNGRIILVSSQTKNPNDVLMERFKAAMPDVADRIIFAPRLRRLVFLKLLACSDVILDPFHFGGGNTTYEALSYGTPIVTMPGEFMRARVTSGCYQKMGFSELIANTSKEYVEIAVRLGKNPEERDRVRAEILSKCDVLYEDYEAVRELEDFFLQALERTNQGESHV